MTQIYKEKNNNNIGLYIHLMKNNKLFKYLTCIEEKKRYKQIMFCITSNIFVIIFYF